MKENNQIQQFHNREFGSLDILMIGEKPYFPATECAATLGYSNPRKAILDHCTKDGVTNRDGIDRLGRTQKKNYINEGNLYRLIIRSKLPAAVRFEKWVFDEVLPTIRKYGAYATDETLDEILRNPKFADALIRALQRERDKNATLAERAAQISYKAAYCDMILRCENAVPVSVIAKDYGMSAADFNAMLHGFGVQYKISGTWLLYQKYAGEGYVKSYTYHVYNKDGADAVIHTCWTQKGRLFLYGFLKERGILPLAEHIH